MSRKSLKIDSVTLFLNGTAAISGKVDLGAEGKAPVTLNVPKKYRNDVLSSLCIGGKGVKLLQPPTMKHTENPDEPRLTLDPTGIIESLGSLSGAEIEVSLRGEGKVAGLLMGVETDSTPEVVASALCPQRYLLVLTDDGQQRVLYQNEISSYRFPQQHVGDQIKKALSRNIEQINPASAAIDFEVQGDADGSAAVAYVQGSAPWTMTYRLFADGDKVRLQGLAHIHNITAEDWNGVEVTVSTANPIDFEPLVADPKVVSRRKVDLATGVADGPREVAKHAAPRMAAARSMSAESFGGLEAAGGGGPMAAAFTADDSAFDPAADATAIGDFVEYTSKQPVSLPSDTNMNVPVLDEALEDANIVLHYNAAEGGKNAYQCVWFTNETGTALRNGAAIVYIDGRFAGRCMVPAAQVDEEMLLPFKAENRVSIDQDVEYRQPKVTRISIASGVIVSETKETTLTKYTLRNVSNDAFQLVIDHPRRYSGEGAEVSLHGADFETFDVPSLERFSFDLAGKEKLTVVVEESFTRKRQITVEKEFPNARNWLASNYLSLDGVDADNPTLRKYVELQQKIDELQGKYQTETAAMAELENEMRLHRENIQTVGEGSPEKSEWTRKLSECVTRRESTRSALTTMRESLGSLEKDQLQTLKGLQLIWENE